jgi:putative ABC transport system ATP-binding protein
MTTEGRPILRTEELTKIFRRSRARDVVALQNIELSIDEGRYVLFRGPSGSGKTTLFTLLAGIAHPTRGCVRFRGEDMSRLSDVALCRLRRDLIGFIFQDFQLFPGLTVLENASIPLLPLNLTRSVRFQKAAALLERLGLEDRLDHSPEEMSGGERQRLAIARALVNDPELILADEPTSNIDTDSAGRVAALFKELNAQGKTVLVTGHRDDLLRDADEVYQLDRGEIVDRDRGDAG